MGRVFLPRSEAEKLTDLDGKTLEKLLGQDERFLVNKITYDELVRYNWGTGEPAEVNRALIELIGVSAPSQDPKDTVMDTKRGPADQAKFILVPKPLTKEGLDLRTTHVIKVKKCLPAPAVTIAALDKWFIPAKETCTLSYTLEGVRERADKLDFDVYASNYCKAAVAADDKVEFQADGALAATPIRHETLKQSDAERCGVVSVSGWKGESEAAGGVLKKRGTARYINVACSPYTVLFRYFKDKTDLDARIDLKPFWPRFSPGDKVLQQDSLTVEWTIEGANKKKLTQGQIILLDKDHTEIFRQGLSASQIAQGKWDCRPCADKIEYQKMPYRIQLQVHTPVEEDTGLALAAMHTEVRLWVHPEVPEVDPKRRLDLPQCFTFGLAPFLCDEKSNPPPPRSIRKSKLLLAKAGYHPGPVNDEDDDDFFVAWRDFQRSHAVKAGDNDYRRLAITNTLDEKTKDEIESGPAARPLFGRPSADMKSGPTDLTDAEALPILNDKTAELTVWIDNRHTYTSGSQVASLGVDMYLGDYGKEMEIKDDNLAEVEQKSIARPWIPFQIAPRLLSQTQDLSLGQMPAWDEAMAHAIGPLRVDWTFVEPKPVTSFIYGVLDSYQPDEATVRTTKFIEAVMSEHLGRHNGNPATNCPTDYGGIRGNRYHAAPFGSDKRSLQPWKALDTGSSVATFTHDDVGQASAKLHADCLGRAGIYFHPSMIAGDGYQLRARILFDPAQDVVHPNWRVLKQRYPTSPQAHTCVFRNWRRTSLRGHVLWAERDGHWGSYEAKAVKYFLPSYLHVSFEPGARSFRLSDLVDLNSASGDLALLKQIIADACTRPEHKDLNRITISPNHVWAWWDQPHAGISHTPGDDVTLADYESKFLDEVWNETWRNYRDGVVQLLISRIEKRFGLMRGHLLVEFVSSPKYWKQRYKCQGASNSKHYNILVEKTSAGDSATGQQCHVTGCNNRLAQVWTGTFKCTIHTDNVDEGEYLADPTGQTRNCEMACGGEMRQTTYPDTKRKVAAGGITDEKYRYTCGICGHQETMKHGATGRLCEQTCNRTMVLTVKKQILERADFPLPAAGCSLGGTWVFREGGRGEMTWAHEMGHGRHLVHAAGVDSDDDQKKDQHDSVSNPLFAGEETTITDYVARELGSWSIEHQRTFISAARALLRPEAIAGLAEEKINERARQMFLKQGYIQLKHCKSRLKDWDRCCVMSYTKGRLFYCGKCILRNRGWKVQNLNPKI